MSHHAILSVLTKLLLLAVIASVHAEDAVPFGNPPAIHGETKCFAAGSLEPSTTKSTGLVLYSMRFCPYCHRVRLVLAAKKIPYEIINIDVTKKPQWFLNRNPLGKIPTLQEPDGTLIYESLLVAEYLDEKFSSGGKLLPANLTARVQQKMLLEVVNEKFIRKYRPDRCKSDEKNRNESVEGLMEVETMLRSDFFSGENVGFVDLMVWPWLSGVSVWKELRGLHIPTGKYPKIAAWIVRMNELPFVKQTTYPLELSKRFAVKYNFGRGTFDCNLGLST
ncbi:putative Glutathione S-transferase omega-2 [Hypsibius exemplaris]|uniref:Glutathione S-transferase omega n=1 Tax=Hypsibius exemplaris TaxID=2072580 RepID=A0A1W0X6T5_HYPEX|nr:putative Glutathione S-transferase omega-2 [Hypsibius exemplaris]